MKKYKICITKPAMIDIATQYVYILEKSKLQQSAEKKIERIYKSIESLEILPFRYKEKAYRGVRARAMLVDDTNIFYIVDKENCEIVVLRIVSTKRNIV